MKVSKVVNIMFILVWLVLMGMLVQRIMGNRGERLNIQNVIAELETREEWMGIYKSDVKVGFVGSSTEVLSDGDYRFEQTWFLRLPVMNQTLDTKIDGYIHTTPSFRPLDFNMSLLSAGQKASFEGEVQDDNLLLRTNIGGQVSEKRIPIDDQFTMPLAFEHMMPNLDMRPGKKYTFDMFNPLSQEMSKVDVEIEGRELQTIQGESVYTTKIKMIMNDVESYVWIDPAGQSIKREEKLMGFVMHRESKEAAMKLPPPPDILAAGDIISDVSVPVNRYISDSRLRRLARLRIGAQKIDWSKYLIEDDRQRIISQTDTTLTIEIRQNRPDPEKDTLSIPVTDTQFQQWLTPTQLIQSDASEIQTLAKKIVGDEDHVWLASLSLGKWVYDNVEKIPTMSIPSAMGVLNTMEGDCNEHTTLFAALARAAGIPARMAIGIVYLDNAFYYHAWPEVWVGTQWIAMDPTFGDMLADATHLKLLEGELDQYPKLLPIIGKINIQVLGYE